MPSLLNELIYKEVRKAFEESPASVFIDYQGFTQEDSVVLRSKAKEVGATARVVKNSIAKLVLKDLGIEGAEALVKGQTIAIMGEDPVGNAKVAVDFAKENKKGEALGGVVDGAVVDAEQVKALSKLPSKEVLVGMFVNVVASPLRGLVTVLNGNLQGLAVALNAIKEKKEQAA